VSVDNELAHLTRMRHQRAGARVNSRVAIAAEWTEAGRSTRVEGHTVDLSPRGCQVILPQEFGVGQRLRIINLANERTCEASVTWRGHQRHSGWELGLVIDAGAEFWGSALPEKLEEF
jgi:hypothetical protein